MATWPSGSKASTTNLDSGTDRPSLARADIKQNVDNVNDIIDMFSISAPSNNDILKYNTSNSRFELASLSDNNTTYTISAVTDGSDANIRLTGSDSSTDDIQLVAGSNITLTVTSAGAIQIEAAGSTGLANIVEDTTPQLGGTLDANGNDIDMGTNTITDTKVGNWDTAYGWGNHASAGYVSSGGALGTPSSGTLTNTTVDGTNSVGYRNIPAVGTKTSSYTLTTSDKGKYVQVGSGGSITIPDSTFAEGDAIVIANNTSGAITITCSITTAYIGGTDTDKATVSLATRGVCNIFFLSGTACIITGNVS